MVNEEKKPLTCGIVMPISAIEGCPAEHWAEVKAILTETLCSINKYEFETRLVSDADDIGVIQKRIVQNLYSSDIVICDVSAKNPNVMFELGMRLAFDKPTIIIKDDKTSYSFDTSIIEHIEYPRDLRFTKIIDFKTKLAHKIVATYESSLVDPKHSPFLKNFGEFKVANLTQTEVSADKMMIDMLTDIQSQVNILKSRTFNKKSESIFSDKSPVLRNMIIKCISDFKNEKNIETHELLNNQELFNFILKNIDGPKYFNGPNEFEEYVNSFIRKSL